MWVIGVYHQVSLFSLRSSESTSTGGKSLLVPSPYSIRAALLDATCRANGAAQGREIFPILRAMTIALGLPPSILVNNCFVRIHKPRRTKSGQDRTTSTDTAEQIEDRQDQEEEAEPGPFIRSVGFREYVQYSGPLSLALETETMEDAYQLKQILPLINYLGKRGGFFQLDSLPVLRKQLPAPQAYVRLDDDEAILPSGASGSLLQILDDWNRQMSFDQVNPSSDLFALGRDRVQHRVHLPYRLLRSSYGFSLYQSTTQP